MSVRSDLSAGWTLRADGCPIEFSGHSVQRAMERLSPGLDEPAIRHALSGMLAAARVVKNPPPWLSDQQLADGWLLVGDDIACPLRWRAGELRVTTMMARGGISPKAREQRKQRRQARSGKRYAGRYRADRSDRPGPTVDDWAEEQEQAGGTAGIPGNCSAGGLDGGR
jgi:hypothetical protein